MIIFHETRLTAREAVDHIQKMRPLIEMKKYKQQECPLVYVGDWLGSPQRMENGAGGASEASGTSRPAEPAEPAEPTSRAETAEIADPV